MKKVISTILAAVGIFGCIAIVDAAPTSTLVQNLLITGVKNAPCLTTDGNGLIGSTSCGTGGGGGSSTFIYSGFGTTAHPNPITTTGTIDVTTSTAFFWNALHTFLKGITVNGTTTLASTTNGYIGTNASGAVILETTPITTTTQITAGGTATGNSFTFATSTTAGKFALNCTGSTCTLTWPPQSDQFYAPSTTIPTTYVSTFNGNSGAATYTAEQTTTPWTGALVVPSSTNLLTTISSSTLAGAGWLNLSQYLTGNQTITFTASGDATGTASGATSLTPTLHVSSIQGVSVDNSAPTTGDTFQYNGSKWTHNSSATVATNLAGPYLATSGGQLTVSSTLASSSLTFNFYGSSTAPIYVGQEGSWITSNQKAIGKVDCWDKTAAATTTHELYYNTSTVDDATSTGHIIVSAIVCGNAGNSTTTFGSSTIPAGAYLWDQVISVAGSPTFSRLSVQATKQ